MEFRRPVSKKLIIVGVLGVLIFLGYWFYRRNCLRHIFTSYIADTVPSGVRLISGNVSAWMDSMNATLEFSTDKETLKEITKGYTYFGDEISDLYSRFPKVKGSAQYYYKEIKKTARDDFGEKKIRESYFPVYLAWQEQTKRVNACVNYAGDSRSEFIIKEFMDRRLIDCLLGKDKPLDQASQGLTKLIEEDLKGINGLVGYIGRFQVYLIANEYEKALVDINLVLGMRNYYIPIMERNYLCDRGDIYMAMGKYAEALDDYNAALKLNNELKDPQIVKKYVEERDLYKESETERYPDRARSFLGGNYDLSTSNDADVLFLLKRAKAYRKLKRYEETIQDLTQAIEEKSSDPHAEKTECYFYRGLVYKEMNEPEKAKKDFAQAQSLGHELVENSSVFYGGTYFYGPYKWYYPDGTLKAQVSYLNGKREGPYTLYRENGILGGGGNYKNDKQEGMFTCDGEGKVIK